MSGYASSGTGDGGFAITPRMLHLISKPGKLRSDEGGQELMDLYSEKFGGFSMARLNPFARDCFTGSLQAVISAVSSGDHPPLNGIETPFKFGYATLVIVGAQRLQSAPPGSGLHAETLKFLLSRGCPPDVPDICQYTALHHVTMNLSRPDIARILLENGARVNYVNIYGSPPIMGALMAGQTEAVEVLMEFGADMTIPDADGMKPEQLFISCGPEVTATVTKWLRRRTGDHWKTHKTTCKPFTLVNTVTLKPTYGGYGNLMPTAAVTRSLLGYPTETPSAKQQRFSQQPTSYPKKAVIKVQVPYGPAGPPAVALLQSLLIYNKKRDFSCQVLRTGNEAAYDRIEQVIRSKGVLGSKGYFVAELKSADELVVKVNELLAEQPF
ncbi:hypothetical protein HETIRDRAFT_428078 [Heterobasidion irregulare TC 32-1]|uniref:Uncharacterized protein n=1 Tax=Heterobasidion irregulare (strain TC 32-1) TaxID=747525 RepID=W4K174_HETIT|nr:uncharacterized protein HETIRDRAFT_428078 [Heterobasidion irregulare TC 32-1]ETW79583.1 hypothetical protein HETIRDRAFT_428078 [Heterobasidion irregulare TC 32-1]